VLWAVSRAIEGATGRDMWHFSAPYPYQWRGPRGDSKTTVPKSSRKPVDVRQETDDRSTIPLAA